MFVAMVAAIIGGVIGWGIATSSLLPIVIAVSIAVLVGFLVRVRLRDERAVPMVAPTSSEAGWADVHREIARARRHERPLAIIRLPGEAGSDADARAAAIAPHLRRIDRTWADHGEVNLLLPETDRAEAERLVERLQARQPDVAGTGASIAAFPTDGLTSGALLAALYGTPLPSVPVPVGVGRPADLPADVIELRPHLLPDPPATDRRESSS
jgi:hypothetical protein